LKRDIEKFKALNTEVLGVLVAKEHTGTEFNERVIKNAYPLLLDTKEDVANAYAQDIKLLKGGRMPGLLIIERDQKISYVHYGVSMKDIPKNEFVLDFLAGKNPQPQVASPSIS
jgi:peroxiredoxin